MTDEREIEQRINSVTRMGRANLRAIRLAHNWCSHLRIERSTFSGVGLVEEQTGLPISPRDFMCHLAPHSPLSGPDAGSTAIRFYDENCASCQKRDPVSFPNLIELVRVRDEQRAEAAQTQAAVAALRAERFQARAECRRVVAERCDEVQKGFVDLIRQLDESPDTETVQRLQNTARAASPKFTKDLRGLLYDLVASGEESKIVGALGALEEVEPNRNLLASTICSVLSDGIWITAAVQMLGSMMEHVEASELRSAVGSVVRLSSPAPFVVPLPLSGPRSDPKPLLAALQYHPGVVIDRVITSLRSGSGQLRRESAHAAKRMMQADPTLVPRLTQDLLRSVLLDDDRQSRPRQAAEEALVTGLRIDAASVSDALQQQLEDSVERDRVLLFGVVETYFRLEGKHPDSDALSVCVKHLVDALSFPDELKRMAAACRLLRGVASKHPRQIARHATELLGAAAVVADRLEGGLSTSLPSVMSPNLRAMEDGHRRFQLSAALDDIVSAISGLAPQFPDQIRDVIIDLLANLSESHDRLRGALFGGMGKIASTAEGLRVVIPLLYEGLMNRSARVRAGAAKSYGEILERFPEALPDLLHDAFLLVLQDPYTIVHQTAMRGIGGARTPDAFRKPFFKVTCNWMLHYSRERPRDHFLGTIVQKVCDLAERDECDEDIANYGQDVKRVVVQVLRAMDPNEAWNALRRLRGRLADTPGLTDLRVALLLNPETHGIYLTEIAEELVHSPPEELRSMADEIVEQARDLRHRAWGHGNPTIWLIDALGTACAWNAVVQLIENWMDDNDLPGGTASTDRLVALEVAATIERAVKDGNHGARGSRIQEWTQLATDMNLAPNRPYNVEAMFDKRVEALRLLDMPVAEAAGQVDSGIATHLREHTASLTPRTRMYYDAFTEILDAYCMLLRWRVAVNNAEVDAERYRKAAQQRVRDCMDACPVEQLSSVFVEATTRIVDISELSEIDEVRRRLLRASLPLPLFLGDNQVHTGTRSTGGGSRQPQSPNPVAVTEFKLDGEPLVSGMAVAPAVVHDLSVTVSMSRWPDSATELVLHPVSVEMPGDFEIPTFRFDAPTRNEESSRQLSQNGRIALRFPQSVLSRPLEFVYAASIVSSDGQETAVHVEGQRRFRIRSEDPEISYRTGFVQVDSRIADISGQLRKIVGLTKKEREKLMVMMAEFGRLAARSVADNLFDADDWTEPTWQKWIVRDFRSREGIARDMEVHPWIGGGITDLSYRGVRCELKVAKNRLVSVSDARSFLQQLAQYVVGSDRRVGLLAILDVSPKTVAPGSVANSLYLETVPDPGGGPFPVVLGVVIVRGNLTRPSDLSR